MERELIKDIIQWDVINWGKALRYWNEVMDIKSKNYTCLELGGRVGGLSLWLALNENKVICSDLHSPKGVASNLHKKYGCEKKITYESIDATNLNFENQFDIVVFKSILGAVSLNGNDKLKKKTIDGIYKTLKPNGKLLFAENLEASPVHKFLREKFISWGRKWNYLKYDEIEYIFSSFNRVNYRTVGFLGALGKTEGQRSVLGKADNLLERLVPKSKRYIIFGIAEK